MRLVAQRIQKQDVKTTQLFERFSRHLAGIGEVSSGSATETKDWRLAMDYRQRFKAGAEQFDGAFNRMEFDLRQSAKFIRRLENIAEHVAQKLAGPGRGIQRQLAWFVLISQRT